MSFESDLKRMEEITDLLKKDDTGLEDAIKLYEEATALGKKLSKTLSEIERKIEIDAGAEADAAANAAGATRIFVLFRKECPSFPKNRV